MRFSGSSRHLLGFAPHAFLRRRLRGLGMRGRVGVIGISLGGVLGGRSAACFSNASRMHSLFGTCGMSMAGFLGGSSLMVHLGGLGAADQSANRKGTSNILPSRKISTFSMRVLALKSVAGMCSP